ncbi:unnamed protein product [Echinostoma caproni]|uniref:Dolichyl-diphosphooligosaccharide--protein glycosyltransferase subunit 1 n=1 Tax=Echinostoma caproni TaxID=27848 RepID=A0A183AY98_9TREM|nr:unnamed protein product [Echinostoma caproni]
MLPNCWSFALLSIIGICSGLKNVKVARSVDLRYAVTRIEHSITINDGSADYHFVVHPSEAARLAFIGATVSYEGKSELKNSGHEFVVTTVLTAQLEPKPAEILQGENQYVKYTGNILFYSEYTTDEQVTNILLPGGEVLRYTDAPEPVSKSGSKITYGPYKDKPAHSYLPLHIHFENNRPFLTVKKMTRHIEVSHWGNVAVEETLEIVNAGAKLRGSFSRLDFDLGHGRKSAVVSFKTALPAAAKDIYYRDEIGNISSSAILGLLDAVEVRLQPRFPLLGGWKTQYTLGYNVPAHEFLYRTGSQFKLKMRFVDHVYDDQLIEDLTVKIVLPELATNIEFIPPYPVTENPREVLKTYLDTTGRTVLVFNARNLVSEHIKDFEVMITSAPFSQPYSESANDPSTTKTGKVHPQLAKRTSIIKHRSFGVTIKR